MFYDGKVFAKRESCVCSEGNVCVCVCVGGWVGGWVGVLRGKSVF